MAIFISLFISGALVGGIYALFAIGLSLLLGVMRVFTVAHGAVLSATALLTIHIANETGWKWLPLIGIGAAIGAGWGIPLELLAIRPFRKRRLLGPDMEHATLIGTFALLYIANALMIHFTEAQTSYFPFGTYPTKAITVGELGQGVIYYIDFVVALVLITLLAAAVRFTQAGRAIRAIASDFRSAQLLGINVNRYSLATSMIACSLAGVAGVLLGMALNAVDYAFGENLLFQGFVIVVVGGVGSISGTLVAALVLAILQSEVGYHLGGDWSSVIAFGVLILFLAVRPQGFFGRVEPERA
jgi:branched-chain amino acid transport system permease protein